MVVFKTYFLLSLLAEPDVIVFDKVVNNRRGQIYCLSLTGSSNARYLVCLLVDKIGLQIARCSA